MNNMRSEATIRTYITQWRKKGEKEKQQQQKKCLNTSVNLTIKSTVQLFREKVQTMQRMHSI